MLLGDPDSQEHKHTMYTLTSRRQAYQRRRLLVNVFPLFHRGQLLVRSLAPPPATGPCHMIEWQPGLGDWVGGESALRRLPRRGRREGKREMQRGEKAPTRNSRDGKG